MHATNQDGMNRVQKSHPLDLMALKEIQYKSTFSSVRRTVKTQRLELLDVTIVYVYVKPT